MTREFEIDLSIRGEYDDTTYEIEPILVQEVHVDSVNSWLIVS